MEKNMLPDYHIHTKLCNHAVGEMEEYVERAISLGIEEMGFSDHMPVMPEPHLCMSFDELPLYVGRVLDLREKYKHSITIRLGCEMDIVHERMDEINGIIAAYPFDYVIGSLHYLDGWPFDQEQYRDVYEKRDLFEIYESYFDAVIRAAETGIHDVVGHIDVIKCMGYRPDADITGLYRKVAETLRARNLVYEINTSGFDKAAGEQFPSAAFIRILREYDVPVTIGSDSHKPEHVGRHFSRITGLLLDCGYENVVTFDRRKRIMKPVRSSAGGSVS